MPHLPEVLYLGKRNKIFWKKKLEHDSVYIGSGMQIKGYDLQLGTCLLLDIVWPHMFSANSLHRAAPDSM